MAALKYRNGALGALAHTVSVRQTSHQHRKLRVYGENGFAELVDSELATVAVEGRPQLQAEPKPKGSARGPEALHRALFEDFLEALLEDREFAVDGREGMKSLELVKAIYLSSYRRQTIRLPLEFDLVV